MTQQTIILDFIPSGVYPVVYATQGDYGLRQIIVKPVNATLSGVSAMLSGTKKDGYGFSYAGEISDGKIYFDVTEQMTIFTGDMLCTVSLANGSGDVVSSSFIMEIRAHALDDDTVISDSDLSLLQQMPSYAGEAKQSASNAEAYAVGTRDGEPVSSDDPTYENNAKYYAGKAGELLDVIGLMDVGANTSGGYSIGIPQTASGDPIILDDGGDGIIMRSASVEIEPVQSGSGTPSPSNIRPISGWDAVKVTRARKNLVTNVLTANISGTGEIVSQSYHMVVAPIKKGQTYTITTDEGTFVGGFFTENPTVGSVTYDNTRVVGSKTFTAPITGFVAFRTSATYTTPQIEYGSTATEYEAYKGQTYTISLSSAGTVYGGTLDAVTGKLVVDRGYIASYNGQSLPSTWISDRDEYAAGKTPTTGAQVVYKLATPNTYTLTAANVSTLLGDNTVFADSGAMDVEYFADTKLYIQGLDA